MRFSSLSHWLQWQENLHFTEIDPGLDRVGEVWQRMGGTSQLPFKVITVAGTNGKGSSVAISSSILRAAGYKTATYTSPHLLRYNERICVNGEPCSDELICQAFERIDQARAEISLTYFEFATLAAVDIFVREQVDVAVLEVGMGGRLDAVNLFDADVALITPVGLDHMQWLGDTREKIAAEKAGIIRSGKPVVLSESEPAESVITHANKMSAPIRQAGQHFHYGDRQGYWYWHDESYAIDLLPYPALMGSYQIQNSAAVIQVCKLLNEQGMTITDDAIKHGLLHVSLAGRFQLIPGDVTQILDVTHNQQGATNLHALLCQTAIEGKTYAVLGMLRDKDTKAVSEALQNDIDAWFLAGLDGSRGMTEDMLADALSPILGSEKLHRYPNVDSAYHAALAVAQKGDRVLIFGSFHTVEAVMHLLPEHQASMSRAS